MDDKLWDTYTMIIRANSPEDIFGVIAGQDTSRLEQSAKVEYQRLAKIVHPDHHHGNQREEYIANEATKYLNEMYQKFCGMLVKGAPQQMGNNAASRPGDDIEFTVGGYTYRFGRNDYQIDDFQTFFGERENNGSRENICLKVPLDVDDNGLIENEASILGRIAHKSLPVLLGTIAMKDGRKANVFRMIPGFVVAGAVSLPGGYTIEQIHESYPQGFPQEHAMWVLERLLSVLGFLHSGGIVHGNIHPRNVTIVPQNHNAILEDFTMAIADAVGGGVYKGANAFSAPEVAPGVHPHPRADMYSLGKTIAYLLGDGIGIPAQSVHPDIRRFIDEMTDSDPTTRRDDAWKAYHDLVDIREKVFGPHRFIELRIPKKS